MPHDNQLDELSSFVNRAETPAIPADHLRVLGDYGLRQCSPHFDHPFLSFEETSAIR
jgi:hypothetical protein